eukprot:CAMPEP_0172415938 /NCGR_PEP_ID=MMETSP1064-20121228/2364_1 /TAXON_ID=202472 /ORGANISM="Aulacoseira subarctica , Strain CCAP 1002/5" /LENGTH=117 /DNA_ID=CAMNT_0013153237 /DNA_START=13 /DNA_END=366 /DNA_ORIENTATION=-
MVFGLGRLFGRGINDESSSAAAALPSYFPVVPKGCEAKADLLFSCIEGEATDRLRAIEQEGKQSDEDPIQTCCRSLILQYQSCCDKHLKKRANWILTESYRVQDEYRYDPKKGSGSS